MTHICVSKLTSINSDNGLSPGRGQAIIWTNAEYLLIRTCGTNFSEIISSIHKFSFKKMHLKMSTKWRQHGFSLNVLSVRNMTLMIPYFKNQVMWEILNKIGTDSLETWFYDLLFQWRHFLWYCMAKKHYTFMEISFGCVMTTVS